MLEKDPIRAISRAFQLPPESRLKQALKDPIQWTEQKQLMAEMSTKLDQLIWVTSLTVQMDRKTLNKVERENPMPTEVKIPDYLKDAIEIREEEKKRQQRSEFAEAVLKRSDDFKKFLAAPRVPAKEDDPEREDDRDS